MRCSPEKVSEHVRCRLIVIPKANVSKFVQYQLVRTHTEFVPPFCRILRQISPVLPDDLMAEELSGCDGAFAFLADGPMCLLALDSDGKPCKVINGNTLEYS